MGTDDDGLQATVLAVLAGVVALVVAGVIAIATATSMAQGGAGGAATAVDGPAAPDAGAVEQVYFDVGSDALTPEAQEVLVRVAEHARVDAGTTVLISGFHDASGDAARNAELAKQRAQAVQHALEANGVPGDRLVLDRPLLVPDGAEPRAARRVDIRVQ